MPKVPKSQWWPNLDDQPKASSDGTPFYPEVRETPPAPVPEPYAQFPWPKGFIPLFPRKSV